MAFSSEKRHYGHDAWIPLPLRPMLSHREGCAEHTLLRLLLLVLGDVRGQRETILAHVIREPTLPELCAPAPCFCPSRITQLCKAPSNSSLWKKPQIPCSCCTLFLMPDLVASLQPHKHRWEDGRSTPQLGSMRREITSLVRMSADYSRRLQSPDVPHDGQRRLECL